jgi:hypothetical protein
MLSYQKSTNSHLQLILIPTGMLAYYYTVLTLNSYQNKQKPAYISSAAQPSLTFIFPSTKCD